MTSFSVRILGAGSASPAQGRHPTAQLLTRDHEHYLIDCGEGTQFRLLEYKARIGRLNSIFISHLHADHYLGLLGLISSLNLGGRTADLYLIGPRGLDEIIKVHLRLSQWPLGFKIIFEEVDATRQYLVFENSRLTVHTIPLDHRVPCAGFLFKEKGAQNNIINDRLPENIAHQHIKRLKEGLDVLDDDGNLLYETGFHTTPAAPPRSYAFCSDTRYDERIVDYIRGCDLLYHEATFQNDLATQARERYHATAEEAARIAQQAGVKQLLIGHFSSRYKDFSGFLHQAQAVFGNTAIAEEGQEFEI